MQVPGGPTSPIGVTAEIQESTGKLAMSMTLSAPLYGPKEFVDAVGNGPTQNFKFDLSAAVALFKGDVGAWQSTGLAESDSDLDWRLSQCGPSDSESRFECSDTQ